MADRIRHIVLIGAGHAHLHLLRHARRFERAGLSLTLVDPGRLSYSGLATSVLGGRCEPADDQIDPVALSARRGGRVMADRAIRVDRETRCVYLAESPPLPYDLLSLNVGSEVPLDKLPGGAEHATAVKPITSLFSLRHKLETRFERRDTVCRIAVIGGGATGCEVAANVHALARRNDARVRITLYAAGDRPLAHHAPGASRAIDTALGKRDIEIVTNSRVTHVERRLIYIGDKTREADITIAALGLRAHGCVRAMGLPVDAAGGLPVDRFLRCTADDRLFGAGDCITFDGDGLPKVGVYGVRQAPILLRNLLARAAGRPLTAYRPQKRYMIILNLGRGEGLLLRGRWHYRGKLSLVLKDFLDHRFLRRYRPR